MRSEGYRLILYTIPSLDNTEGRCSEARLGAVRTEADYPRQRATVSAILYKEVMNEFFIYYVKGRVFEWTMALGMLLSGLELLLYDNVLTFGAFRFMLLVMSQKWIGTLMLFTGWLRISGLMFNGQLLFGRRFGFAMRAGCSILSATIWAQFAFALFVL